MFLGLKNKKILLGVTGGIAVYKSCELVRIFKKYQAEVKVVMTKAATEFVKPLTFKTLSGCKVYSQMFVAEGSPEIDDLQHINLARFADCIVIAPATANCIAKLANGIADDLLSTVLLATTAPVCLAPAMNKEMWNHFAMQKNVRFLQEKNVNIFGPAYGQQACGECGMGKMLEPQVIAELTERLFFPPLLHNKNIIITAGPTLEPIDPIRYISNRSSGKTGYALAQAAKEFGANITLISGPTNLQPPIGIEFIKVNTANEMLNAVMSKIRTCNIFISVAAVADFRVDEISKNKIKKTSDNIMFNFIKNTDILAEVTKLDYPIYTVGFAAETHDIEYHATQKLAEKNLDIIVANQVGENLVFDSDESKVTIFTKQGEIIPFETQKKVTMARQIMLFISEKIVSTKL